MNTLKRIYALLTSAERRQLYWLLPAVILMGFVEVVGIASIMPFLALLSQPDAISSNALLRWAYTAFGFQTDSSFLIFVGVGVLVILTLSNAFTFFITWTLARFTWLRNHSISRRLLAGYLFRPYTFFLNRNTSELNATLFSEVREVVLNLLVPLVRAVSRLVVAIFILGFLLIYDPLLALVTFSLLGGAYTGIFLGMRRTLSRVGAQRVAAQKASYRVASEALNGIKDIKVLGKEDVFLKRFSKHSKIFAQNTATGQSISFIPRYSLEVIAFGGILVIVIYYLAVYGSVADVLPILGLYAFASYRLLPAMQSIFETLSMIQVNGPMLESIVADLQSAESVVAPERNDLPELSFAEGLRFNAVSYSYPETQTPVLKELDLHIKPGSSVAFVGSTGSGKTTAVDLILGLLEPSSGFLTLDGIPLDGRARLAWQAKLGYVPQHIHLSDDSVLRNIALGVNDAAIDKEAAIRAAKAADLHDFIESLAEGYSSEVGERGVRMSGGQRQRLGIARALYHQPQVLILDEATSALDNRTEESVLSAIEALSGEKTLISIAHRLSTVQHCDDIFMLERGRLVARGRYQELLDSSPEFAALTKQSKGASQPEPTSTA